MSDRIVIAGGIIPQQDIPELKKLGIAEIFTPGSSMESTVNFIREKMNA